MTDMVVVGGGLAGLVAARHLAESGRDVTVLEADETVGGRVRSIRTDGYVFDRGFQVLFTAYPAARRELDYDALDLRSFTAGATVARPGRRSVLADPLDSPGDLTETLFNTEVRLGDKVRLLRLRRALAGVQPEALLDRGPDEDVESFLRRKGFSRAFVDNVAAPFYGGVTLDRSLSTDAGVFRYTFRMLSEGTAAVPARGMGAIPEQLAERAREAGADIETGTPVTALDAGGDGVRLETVSETVSADAAVVATDPATAGELTGVDTPTEMRGCVTQFYGLPGRVELDTGRKLLLNAAGGDPNHVVPHSAVAPEYAPADRTLLGATWLGDPGADDDALFERARDALASWYPERRFDELELLRTERVEAAQLVQPPGFRRERPDPTAPEGPVVLAGDYTRWSSIQGAMESGRVAAALLQ